MEILAQAARRLAQYLRQRSGSRHRPLSDLDALRSSLIPSSGQRRVSRLDDWFPPRQFVVRQSGGHSGPTLVVDFSQRLQVTLATGAALGLACLGVATATAAWNGFAAGQMAAEVESLRGVARQESEAAAQARALLARLQPELARSVAERDRATAERDRVRSDAATLLADALGATLDDNERLAQARARLESDRDAAVVERDVALSANRQLLTRLDSQTRDTIAQIENIIAATGLDLTRLDRDRTADDRALPRGGPFVPWPPRGEDRGSDGRMEGASAWDAAARLASARRIDHVASGVNRLLELGGFLARVPLASPLAQIDVAAGFGFRLDPFSREAAAHEGLDLASSHGAPVFATAAGVVTFAGWKGDYGNTVEIDHGMGLSTRYAHLSSFAVKPGDAVVPRQMLGGVGATGRATGAHLHYETRVDGQARNPIDFLRAARHVQ